MLIELRTNQIPAILNRFTALIGRSHWEDRVNLINSEIKGNGLLKPYLLQENSVAFGLHKYSKLAKLYEHSSIPDAELEPLYEHIGFAAQILSLATQSSEQQKKVLIRRVQGALKNPDDMRALLFELDAAAHFLKLGLTLCRPEVTGEGTMDLIVEGIDLPSVEIECKSISEDKGRKIHRRDAIEFFHLLSPELNQLGKGLKSGLVVTLSLEERLPIEPLDRCELAQSVIKSVLAGNKFQQLNKARLHINDFDVAKLGNAGATTSELNIDEISQTHNNYAIVLARDGGGAIVFILKSSQDDSTLKAVFKTLSKSASKQLSKKRAGLFLVQLEGIDRQSLTELAKQQSTSRETATQLQIFTNDFLASSGRDHVIGVIFLSRGAFESNTPDLFSKTGASYMFSNKRSPYWHSDFAGLFS